MEDNPIIGTLAEHNLHSALKSYFEEDKSKREVRVGRYVADICGDDGIIEIQTHNLGLLRNKLEYYLQQYKVTVVHPQVIRKKIVWIDKITGEIREGRNSPKKGGIYSSFDEICRIKDYLKNENLTIKIVMVDIVEYIYALKGYENRNKRYASKRAEQVPTTIGDIVTLKSREDYSSLIPQNLNEKFTSNDFAKAAKIPRSEAQTVLNIMNHIGAVERIDHDKNGYIYRKA